MKLYWKDRIVYFIVRWRYGWRDELCRIISWKVPERFIYWATIRAGAVATTGAWEHVNASETTLFEVLERVYPRKEEDEELNIILYRDEEGINSADYDWFFERYVDIYDKGE